MFAIIAAIIFGLALLLDFLDVQLGDAFTSQTLVTAGLLCLALHAAGVGASTSWRRRRTDSRR
jgi:uncharacterized membrane protein YbhN (UPF0104 family)